MSSKIPPDVARGIERLYQQHCNDLLEFAFRLTRSRDRAEDAVHEAFYAAALNWNKCGLATRGKEGRRSWLFAVVKNKCIDQYRSLRFTVALPDFDVEPSSHDTAEEALLNLAWKQCEEVVLRIPKRQYDVLVLFLQDWSRTQIANHLGITTSTVGSHLCAARKILRNEAGPQVPFLDDRGEPPTTSADEEDDS